MPVWQAMSTQVHTITEYAGALDAFRLMSQADTPRLVVLDDASGRMVGIVSQADLMRAIQVRMMGFQVVSPTPVQVQVQRATNGTDSPPVSAFGYTDPDARRNSERYARPL